MVGNAHNFFRSFRFVVTDSSRISVEVSKLRGVKKEIVGQFKSVATDFSITGMGILCSENFSIGESLQVVLGKRRKKFYLNGVVTRCKEIEGRETYEIGVQFYEDSYSEIVSFIDLHLCQISKTNLISNVMLGLSEEKTSADPKAINKKLLFNNLIRSFQNQSSHRPNEKVFKDVIQSVFESDVEYHYKEELPVEIFSKETIVKPLYDLSKRYSGFLKSCGEISKSLTHLIKYVIPFKIQGGHSKETSREHALIGKSPIIFHLRAKITELIESPKWVHIQGERGTGKTYYFKVLIEEMRKKKALKVLSYDLKEQYLNDFETFKDLVKDELENESEKVLLIENIDSHHREVFELLDSMKRDCRWVFTSSSPLRNTDTFNTDLEITMPGLETRKEDLIPMMSYYLRKKYGETLEFPQFIDSYLKTCYFHSGFWQLFSIADAIYYSIKHDLNFDFLFDGQVFPEFYNADIEALKAHLADNDKEDFSESFDEEDIKKAA
ncbi:MAG: PilZ domain-containing protein [Bacteriovoracaceae bacterium]